MDSLSRVVVKVRFIGARITMTAKMVLESEIIGRNIKAASRGVSVPFASSKRYTNRCLRQTKTHG